MSTPYEAKFVRCPYYHKHESHRIACEGLDDDNAINIIFTTKGAKNKYMSDKCFSIRGCRTCAIHQVLDAKYEEDEDG